VLTRWLFAFAFTQMVEIPIYMAALSRWAPGVEGRRRQAAIAFGASALTHPFVWFVFPACLRASYLEMAIAAESFAVIVEGLYLWGLGLRGRPGAGRFAAIAIPFASSLAANFASVTLALASRAALGRP
jgi:hypothetical protein